MTSMTLYFLRSISKFLHYLWSIQVIWTISIPWWLNYIHNVCCITEASQHNLATREQKYTDLKNSEIPILWKKHINIKKYTFHHKAKSCSIVKTNFLDKNQPDKLKYNRITAQGRFLENLIYQSRPLKGCKIVKTCPIFKIQKVFPFFTSGLAHQYWLNAMRLSVKKGFDSLIRVILTKDRNCCPGLV